MDISAAVTDRGRVYDWIGAAAALAALVLGLWIAERSVSVDQVMSFHAVLFTLAALAGAALLISGFNGAASQSKGLYSDNVVKAATIATVFWGVVGFLIGDILAWQLSFPALNLDLPWTNFGRLRPVHTSAVIFAFGGNALLGTSFYVVQRTCRRPALGRLSLALVRLLGLSAFHRHGRRPAMSLGVTQGKEYAEPEWYTDIWLTIVWVAYLLVFLGTLWKRKEPHIYVANWFYLAFIITIAMLHIVNNLALPVSFFGTKSYQVYSGVQDAMIQWWYGHNAVGFFLTAGFLGMMYYFVPKRAERPIYSYRLSIVHFWSLIFLYIWAGPHHLHYTALPDWAQTLGHGLFDHAVDAVMGRHDQRSDDAVGRVGQAAHRPGPALLGRLGGLLRHVHVRGAGDVDQARSTPLATTPTGRSATCIPAHWAGSAMITFGARLLSRCRGCGRERSLFATARRVALLDRDDRHRALHHLDVGRRHHAGPHVARLRR